MKTAFFLAIILILIIAGCAGTPPIKENPEKDDELGYAQRSGNFSDQGAIAFLDKDFRFTIILVKDLDWALESTKIADYGLPHISRFKRSEKVTPFLTFGIFEGENFDLTYSVKLQRPDGKFAPGEHNDMAITNSSLFPSMTYWAQEFATFSFGETDTLGSYQFYIIIKDRGKEINACIMQFELIE